MTTGNDTAYAVRDNPEQQRFEMETSAGLAVAEYRRDGDTLIIFHTEVPPALRGQGMGDKLVRGVLEDVRRRNLKVVPRCWFVREFVGSHPEYRDLIA
ncbi:GNAT family N-acetyltransferase [Hyphomicrobium sp. CS1BSMeth3]|uniref:GNAT family N-acetyltransferase n=1 Tax=Hyphomicrobium sp. CS1BSMeth3 TaxID=1892844 RepID=UPI000930873A|nr:GNAT family N-acetyltransferase [Hyphomicrobium sp. CS1BSMeth3]